jgi:sulfur relay protein TusB/DsrH
MTVYLVDEPFLEVALSYAAKDPEAKVVLLQDAVYSCMAVEGRGGVFVVADDVERRGLGGRMPAGVRTITYDELVAMMETERVVNFL